MEMLKDTAEICVQTPDIRWSMMM